MNNALLESRRSIKSIFSTFTAKNRWHLTMRKFFTVMSMPLLIKISLGSPMAGGVAGNMDTMLAPVTRFVGVRLGLVTLITGTLLTFIVPFLLPVMSELFAAKP